MLTRCPNCGAGMSLDALIAHEECRQLLAEVMQVGLPYGRAVIRYLGLFRPAKRELRMERVARLLRELLPDLQRGAITRAGRDWPLTPEQWQAGLQAVLDAADKGTLQPPLADHGYLHQVLMRLVDKSEASAETEREAGRRAAPRAATVQVKGRSLPIGEALQVAYAGKDPALAKLDADAKAATPMPADVRAQISRLRGKRDSS